MKFQGNTNEILELKDIDSTNCKILSESPKEALTLLWFKEDGNQFEIDFKDHEFEKNRIIFLTEFHQVKAKKIKGALMLRFNRPFYCISDHDSEVGCRGLLFYAAAEFPNILPEATEVETFETIIKMLRIEMATHDALQLEMLQMMLKRILILCTRIYKRQSNYKEEEEQKADIVRAFNFLVEQHYRNKHTVAEYADLLHKSPKTLTNLFKKHHARSPLKIIQERRMTEARRQLRYSDKPVSEIADEIGFIDVQSFSRFFKKQQGISPTEFREAA